MQLDDKTTIRYAVKFLIENLIFYENIVIKTSKFYNSLGQFPWGSVHKSDEFFGRRAEIW